MMKEQKSGVVKKNGDSEWNVFGAMIVFWDIMASDELIMPQKPAQKILLMMLDNFVQFKFFLLPSQAQNPAFFIAYS
jgi:hypothetical protein